jgi:uncharacterized protein with FMN-binding domain
MKQFTRSAFMIAALTLAFFFSGCMKPAEVSLHTPDLKKLPDGQYTGSYKIFPVSAAVRVTVKEHRIVSIDILSHFNGKGKEGEKVTGRVIALQSVEVESVTGATYSSKTILKAVENALENRKQ